MTIKHKKIYFILLLCVFWIGIFANVNAKSYRYYYEQLNETEKQIYDKILEQVDIQNREITIEWPEKIEFETVTRQDPELEEKKQQSSEEVKQRIQNVLDALIQDEPQFFWMDIGTTTEKWSFQGSGIIGNIVWTMKPVEISIGTDYTPEQVQELNQRVEGIDIPGETRQQKLDVMHRYLCELIEYDATAAYAHEPYGALIEGRAVCEGYARSLKWLCDREGIPCVLVIGDAIDTNGNTGGHMWNYVQMENGAWYAIDATWDDQIEVLDEYFLVGSETKDSYFGGMTFAQSHIPSGDFSGSGYKIFEYPPLNAEAYDPDAEPIVTEPAVQQENVIEVPSIQQDNPETENQTQAQQLLQIVDGMIESGQKAVYFWFDAIISSDMIYQVQTWVWFFVGVFLTVLFVVAEEMKK
ncbi:Transglutaminase-like superfamily protein [Clostridiales bacterium CHKCI001]|nr:Transglutaminase-like superfamily protein [Clostridiales bacterium CHKCI001]